MGRRKEIEKELKKLSSTLTENFPKPEYELPEKYFSDMQDQVIQKMDTSTVSETNNKKQMIWPGKWIYTLAASIILILGAVFVFNQLNGSSSNFDVLEEEEIFAYLNDNLEDISLDMLISDEANIDLISLDEEQSNNYENYLEEYIDELSIEDLEITL